MEGGDWEGTRSLTDDDLVFFKQRECARPSAPKEEVARCHSIGQKASQKVEGERAAYRRVCKKRSNCNRKVEPVTYRETGNRKQKSVERQKHQPENQYNRN